MSIADSLVSLIVDFENNKTNPLYLSSSLDGILELKFPFLSVYEVCNDHFEFLEALSVFQYFPSPGSSHGISPIVVTAVKKIFSSSPSSLSPLNSWCLVRLDPLVLEASECIPSTEAFQRKLIKANTDIFYRQPRHSLFRECSAGFAQLATQLLIPGYCLEHLLCHYLGEYDLDPFRGVSVFVSILSAQLDSYWIAYCMSNSLVVPHQAATVTHKKALSPEFLQTHLLNLFDSKALLNIMFPVLCLKLETTESLGLFIIVAIYCSRTEKPVSALRQFTPFIKLQEHWALFFLAVAIVYSSNLSQIKHADISEEFSFSMKPTKSIPMEIEDFLNAQLGSSEWSSWPQWILKLIAFFRTGWMQSAHSSGQPVYKAIAALTGMYGNSALGFFCAVKFDEKDFRQLPLDAICFVYFPSSLLIFLIDNFGSKEPWAPVLLGTVLGLVVCLKRESSLTLHQHLWNSAIGAFPTETRYQMYDFASLIKTNTFDSSIPVRRLLRRISSDNVSLMKTEFLDTLHQADVFLSVSVIIDQISAYENLGDPLVGILGGDDNAEHTLSNLYADVFSWTILSKHLLQKAPEMRLKEDGLHVRPWLTNLSSFTSKLLSFEKRMDLGPFLQYLASITNSDDPGLLADLYAFLPGILSRIGGIPPILEELSASQISCLAGGKLLKFCSQQCPSDYFATRHSVPRILQAATPHLICQLWISLALLPIRLVSVERGGHVKALSWLIDSLCRTFLQFTEAVSIWIKSEDDVPDLRSQMIDILFPSPMNVDFASGDDSVLSCFCSQTGLDLSRAMLIINTLSMEEKPNYRIVDGIFWKLSLSNIKFPESEYDRLIALLEEQPFSSSHSLQGKRDRVMLASLRSSILAEKLLQESLLFKFDSQDCRTKEHSYCIDRGLCCWQSEFDILERAIIPRVLLSLSDAIFCAYWIQKCHEAEWPLSTLILLDRLFGVSIVLLSGLSLQESINFGRFLRVILEWLSSISHINIQDLPSEAVDTLAFAYSVSGHKLGFCPHIRRTRRMVLNTASVDSNLESARICTEPSASPIVNDENISATSELVLGSDPSENAAEETPTCDGYANSSCLHASSEDAAATRSTKFCSMLSNATSAATSDPLSFSQFGSVFRKWHIKLYRSFAKVLNLTSHCRENYTSYCRTRNALVVLTLLVDSVFPVLDTHGMGLERLISPLATTSKDSTSSSNDNEDIRLLAKRCLSLLRARSVCWISSVSTATSAGAVTSANAAPDIKTPVLSSPLLDLSSANSIALPVTATMAATPEPVELAPVQKQILEKIKDVVNSSPSKKESSSKPPSAKDTILKEPYKSSSKSEPSKKESSSIKEERMRGAPFPRGPLKERRSGQADVPRSNVPGDSLRPGVNESSRAPIGDSTAHHRSHRFEDEDRSSSSSSSSRPAIRSFSSSSSSSDRKRRQDPRMPSRRY